MADEKILKDELMSDEELDGVAGGTRLETFADGNEYPCAICSTKWATRATKTKAA